MARDAGLSRESLYKALSGEHSPSFETILQGYERWVSDGMPNRRQEGNSVKSLHHHNFLNWISLNCTVPGPLISINSWSRDNNSDSRNTPLCVVYPRFVPAEFPDDAGL